MSDFQLDTIVCMDALAFLKSLPDRSADAVITDPPYGLAGRVFEFPHKHYAAVNEAWDHEAPLSWMEECGRVLKPGGSVVCFGGRRSIYEFAAKGLSLEWRLVNDITWEKPDAPPNFTGRMMTESTERALWFCPDGKGWTYNLSVAKAYNNGANLRDVWQFNTERKNRYHPTQKPLALMQRVITLLTPVDGLVVDCFAGSGTTLVAAKTTGRSFVGCDLEPRYVKIATQRLGQVYGVQDVSVQSGMFETVVQS